MNGSSSVRVAAGAVTLDGDLSVPERARGVVLFAQGSGSSRLSPRNRHVAQLLNEAKLATLLLDLLTPTEEAIDLRTAHLRFDIGLLAERLVAATDWLMQRSQARHLPVGYFGASRGAGAALVAAAERPDVVRSVVSRGGRPDMAGPVLSRVRGPTLLIVGEVDFLVVGLNQEALAKLTCEKRLVIVPGATHLFEEPGALDEVARLAREWFERYLAPVQARMTGSGAREASGRRPMTKAALEQYATKRRFDTTPEPAPRQRRSRSGRLFVVQKHRARQLHYDFRLEVDGVLKSWSVPKGPSLDPSVRRLAVAVEDHPVDYADFEGVIPEGEYGGGTVMVWDRGTYQPEDSVEVAAALLGGRLAFTLQGEKLKGGWSLVRVRGRDWLLIKRRDRYASTRDITVEAPTSVLSGRTLARIAADEGGDVAKAPPTRRAVKK